MGKEPHKLVTEKSWGGVKPHLTQGCLTWTALTAPWGGEPHSHPPLEHLRPKIHNPRMQEMGVHIIPWPEEMVTTHQRAGFHGCFFLRGGGGGEGRCRISKLQTLALWKTFPVFSTKKDNKRKKEHKFLAKVKIYSEWKANFPFLCPMEATKWLLLFKE